MARAARRPGDPRPPGVAAVLVALVLLIAGLLIGRASAPSGGTTEASSSSGPVRVERGVPVGHARTREGAAAAVASYQRAFADATILQPDVMRQRLEVVASPTTCRQCSPPTRRVANDWR